MKKGFTLIELLIVIAIIGIIVVAVTVALNPAKRISDAQDAALRAQVAAVGQAFDTCMGYVDTATAGAPQNLYAGCNTMLELTASPGGSGGAPGGPWLKSTPTGTWGFLASAGGGNNNGCVYTSGTVAGATTYFIFRSSLSSIATQTTAPLAADCP